MNKILANRLNLSLSNYVLKADISTGYWVGFAKSKIELYRKANGDDFNIIIFGDKDTFSDYYIVPFAHVRGAFQARYMYGHKGRYRWVASIKDHCINFRVSKISLDISSYYSIPI
ncbi:MAG: hypothetical protein BGO69_19455 [Bacteroidetes bacterium 46-16]|nr:MAG: hypothetical protein BGO69_19455 [Bacteroidetes bacterium 46-16]